jgi:hypothetical protein
MSTANQEHGVSGANLSAGLDQMNFTGGPGGTIKTAGAVPTATDDVIKLQEKILKQQNKCVSYHFLQSIYFLIHFL